MIKHADEVVVYPYQGPCRVGAVVKKSFGGGTVECYPLTVMDGSGDVLFVPVEKFQSLGIRRLVSRTDIPLLMTRLGAKNAAPDSGAPMRWRQRAIDNSKLLASRSAFDLAAIINALTELDSTKALSPRDRHVLDRARKNLICEISEATGESRSAAEQQLDDALNMRKRDLKQIKACV